VHDDLIDWEERVSRKRIIRLMQDDSLKARVRKRYKVTTMSDHDQPSVDIWKPAIHRHRKPGHSRRAIETSEFYFVSSFSAQVGLDFGTPAARSTLEHMRMMKQAIEQRGYGRRVAEQLAPVVDGSI
jgi:hypothetical protein